MGSQLKLSIALTGVGFCDISLCSALVSRQKVLGSREELEIQSVRMLVQNRQGVIVGLISLRKQWIIFQNVRLDDPYWP